MTANRTRLARIETKLPPPPIRFDTWVLGKPEEDQRMILHFVWALIEVREKGAELELRSGESLAMAICRVCELDYCRVSKHMDEWRRIGG